MHLLLKIGVDSTASALLSPDKPPAIFYNTITALC
jgi:hypothetical protein